jgi:pilus assembly protein CpaE
MAVAAATKNAEGLPKEERDHFQAFVSDPETGAVVEQVVGDLMFPHAAIRKGTIEDGIKFLGENRSPKLLVVDISGVELPLSEINNLADVCEPGVTVIAVGDRNDVGLFRDLIHHGVADYLVKPLTPPLLQRSLLSAADHTTDPRQMSKLGKLIGVIGSRGGAGATMLATSASWLLAAERRRRVALVDLDLQFGTVALSLDLEPSHGLREALENPNRIDGLFLERAMVQHSDRLFVLSAEESLDESLLLDYAALELVLTELRNKFHYVVVDLPRVPSPCSHQVLQTASNLIVVTDLSLAGMRDTMRLLSLLPVANAACQISVVANRVGEHKQGEMPVGEFEKGIGRKIDHILPFDPKTVAAAANVGQPIAAGKGPVAAGLHAVVNKAFGAASPVGRTHFWQRWLKG